MLGFALNRLARGIPTLLLAAVAVFGLIRLLPGDPALLMLGDLADPESLARMRGSLGLDQPLPAQFAIWLGQIFEGDLGRSISSGQPVLPLILDRFSVTASIVLVAVLLAVLIAVPAGLYAAWRQDSLADVALVAGATLLLSIPSFWLGLLLLLLFGLTLDWLPVVGFVSMRENFWAGVSYLVLPVVTLALVEAGAIVRMMRASTLEVLHLDYVTHARAKGLDERAVLLHHAGINAFAPTWTMIGLTLGNLLGGIAVIETVFTLPGLGRLIVDAIFARDYPVVQGCLLFVTATYVVVNLVVDLCYPLFDPRVRL